MPESYTVLARRYRSQDFASLVGQENIAQTLKNAIISNRVAHAFLFTGTRGVGKTSAARILAKALNCPNATAGEPCNTCDTCSAIARAEDLDVIEIDGASNNGVDQVRELRQNAGIRPARSRYKIYIIDEVHMLSMGAFNALLKTLEEPPSHVKFIFATTDVHKVPATIISRCQRFDFKNIPTARIAEHLRQIVKAEGVTADDDALFRMARLGNGSMRDALSILDRVMSLGEKRISEKILEELLGKPPAAALAELVEALAAGDAAEALRRADVLVREGLGVEQLLGDLVDFFRNIMLVCVCGEKTELLEVPADLRPLFVGLSQKYDGPTLVHFIALCEQVLRSLKAATMARPLFDALIVRLAMAEQFSSINEILKASAAQNPIPEKKNEIAAAPPSVSVNGALAPAPIPPGDNEPDDDDDLPAPGKVWKREPVSGQAMPAANSLRPARAVASAEEESSVFQQLRQQLDAAAPVVAAQRPAVGRPPVASLTGKAHGPAVSAETAEAIAGAVAAILPATPPEDLTELWQLVRRYLVATRNTSINAMLGASAHLVACDGETREANVIIPSNLSLFAQGRPLERLQEALSAIFRRPMKVALTISDAPVAVPAGAGEASRLAAVQRVSPEVEKAVRASGLIRMLQEKVGGDVAGIEVIETES